MEKIALAQINTIFGQIEKNAEKIIEAINCAKKQGAKLVVFPSFALIGMPFGDVLNRHLHLIELQNDFIQNIKQHCENIHVLLEIFQNDGRCHLLLSGKEAKIIEIFELNETKFSVFPNTQGQIIIYPDANPSRKGTATERLELFGEIAKSQNAHLVWVNKVGYGDNYCFDGASAVFNPDGEQIYQLKSYEEEIGIFSGQTCPIAPPAGDIEQIYKNIVYSIKQYFAFSGFKRAVLGVSGGLDSAVCTMLLKDALGPENVLGVWLPSKINTKTSYKDALALVALSGINFIEVPITPYLIDFKPIFKEINFKKTKNSTTAQNLQARTRATILWSIANEFESTLPIATSDKSEFYLGYATVNGDMSGGFAPIADVLKTTLFELGKFLNLPKNILKKPPGAELKLNSKTKKPITAEEDNMPYAFLDEVIRLVEGKNYGPEELLEHFEGQEAAPAWIEKFYSKMQRATFKWHICPPSVIVDSNSIFDVEYHQPIISKI